MSVHFIFGYVIRRLVIIIIMIINNKDVTRVDYIVLKEAPNSNDATHVSNNVHLTNVSAQQFSMVAI